jgi:hypothetical protein
MRYCETPDEVKKNPDAKYWISKVCNGDASAESLLWSWWNFFHMFDDLIDQDKEAPKEMIIKECMLFMSELSYNNFYQINKSSLHPMLIQFFNRWIDGDDWEQSGDPWKESVSDVLRCGDMEIYFHFAYLCGGWDHMRECKGVRCYDRNKIIKD